jgi:hypothetical protein
MEHGISEIFGEGVDRAGRATPVYRALRELLCSGCGAIIPEESLFTRKTLPQLALRILPRCRECTPFELPAGDPGKRSKLLDSLMSPARETGDGQPETGGEQETAAKQKDDPRRDVSAEIERRLGPALSRGRRKRT